MSMSQSQSELPRYDAHNHDDSGGSSRRQQRRHLVQEWQRVLGQQRLRVRAPERRQHGVGSSRLDDRTQQDLLRPHGQPPVRFHFIFI